MHAEPETESSREAALKAALQRAQDRIVELEAALGMGFLTPLEWGLTGQQVRLFGCLMARELMTTAAGMAAMYGDVSSDGLPDPKIIDVQICKMRARLKDFGVVIKTRWGEGYYLEPTMKDHVRHLMAGAPV